MNKLLQSFIVLLLSAIQINLVLEQPLTSLNFFQDDFRGIFGLFRTQVSSHFRKLFGEFRSRDFFLRFFTTDFEKVVEILHH